MKGLGQITVGDASVSYGLGALVASHRTIPLEFLERITFSKSALDAFMAILPSNGGINGLIILSTCNRVEIYFSAKDPASTSVELLRLLATFWKVSLSDIKPYFTLVINRACVSHLFEVTSGFRSMVLGEGEILGQVKQAYEQALIYQTTDTVLNKCFQMAISVGKRARSETSIGNGSHSVTSIAIDKLMLDCPHFFKRDILIVGAGTMGIRSLKKLKALAHPSVTIVNRTDGRSQQLVSDYGIQMIPYSKLSQLMAQYPIIISATCSPNYLVTEAHFCGSYVTRYIVDLGLPRNVDPNVAANRDIHVLSLSLLKTVAEKTLADRSSYLSDVRLIFDEEMAKLETWFSEKQKRCLVSS